MSKKFDYLKASKEPVKAIDLVSYEGQNPKLRQYQAGFEPYFNQLPRFDKIEGDDSMTDVKLAFTRSVMKDLSTLLASDFISTTFPNEGEFERTIIAIEDPTHIPPRSQVEDPKGQYIAGKQLIVAHWGKGFESPVHGHATGYLHEQLLNGKLKLNTFRIVDEENKVVIPYKTEIITPGVFISDYVPENPNNKWSRQTLVHSFNVLEPSTSLHYLPEYNRDGRDNQFSVKHFSDENTITVDDVERITSKDGMYLRPGDVVLVRSTNVPEYGDHFIVVLGPPVMKEHGLRVQDWSIMATDRDTALLDQFEMKMGLTLLKLKPEMKEKFLKFHGAEVNEKVEFVNII